MEIEGGLRPVINGFSGGSFWILEERKKKRGIAVDYSIVRCIEDEWCDAVGEERAVQQGGLKRRPMMAA
jgi:hypothetical protein